jgi:apolipoprotein N-acyltransferase
MLYTILLVFAFVLFVIAAFPVACRFNLVAAGLACWVLTELLHAGAFH